MDFPETVGGQCLSLQNIWVYVGVSVLSSLRPSSRYWTVSLTTIQEPLSACFIAIYFVLMQNSEGLVVFDRKFRQCLWYSTWDYF